MENYFIAPHPDDETLGCGGTISRLKKNKEKINWIIVTSPKPDNKFDKHYYKQRASTINKVSKLLEFDNTYELDFPTSELNSYHIKLISESISKIIISKKNIRIFCPYPGDAHSDHKICFDSIVVISKWFRYPEVKEILCYETLSESEFGINPLISPFKPNIFSNIDKTVQHKLQTLKLYKNEINEFPFPRSLETVKALAKFRGSQAGFNFAEAFMLIKGNI